jgi:hypothetical protein
MDNNELNHYINCIEQMEEEIIYFKNEINKIKMILHKNCNHVWKRTFESYESIEYYCNSCKTYK